MVFYSQNSQFYHFFLNLSECFEILKLQFYWPLYNSWKFQPNQISSFWDPIYLNIRNKMFWQLKCNQFKFHMQTTHNVIWKFYWPYPSIIS